MKIREYAEAHGVTVVGKLKRMPDVKKGEPWYMDEAGNEFLMSPDRKDCVCIITADGGVI